MKRCLDLASMAYPACRPNPMVGAVLVHDGRIIGEGRTQAHGGPHAEVMAIKDAGSEYLKESTLYVSLEPCAHHGLTPPCADMIVDKGIPRVVIACQDPFDQVNGKGAARLRSNGIEVTMGVLGEEARRLNKRFFTFHEKKRPYVILKWAESKDGFIDQDRIDGEAAKISGTMMNQLVHQWRAEEQAILIGSGTAIKDDPSLTTRLVTGPDPERIVWTSKELSPDLELSKLGYTSLAAGSVDELLDKLYQHGIQSVLVEGGRQVLESFIESGHYDEVRRILGRTELEKGVRAPRFEEKSTQDIRIGEDRLLEYINTL